MKSGWFPSLLALFAAGVGMQSCMTDNPAAYTGILGPERKEPIEPTTGGTGSGGTSAIGGTTGGSAPTGGATVGPGGMAGEGDGGEGATGTSGTGGSAGTGTVNPPEDPNYSPACFRGPTTAGEEILKGVACTPEDTQLCYRPCGPNQVGWKTEECIASVYAEGDCTFPPEKDYSCYKIPDVIDEVACGLDSPPAATTECDAPPCMVCNFEGSYQDSGDNAKTGFCVCRDADATGVRRWTCASDTAWPCPLNLGCF